MPKIIKFVAMQEDPVVISHKQFVVEPAIVSLESEPIEKRDIEADAVQKAAQIIAEAEEQAKCCLAEVQQQSEEIKQQFQQQGYEEGLLQGKQAALQQMQQSLDQAIHEGESILATVEQQAVAMMVAAERDIINIAMATAEKILSTEVEENSALVLAIVKAALDKVRDQDRVIIRVNPVDFDRVLQAKQDLQTSLTREQAITITADAAVEASGCMIDTSNGTVDARLSTQMEAVKQALMEVLP